MSEQEEQQTDEAEPQTDEAEPQAEEATPQAEEATPQSDEDADLVASLPPRDGSANDPVASAEASLADVDMDAQREALKKIQKDLPSAGA